MICVSPNEIAALKRRVQPELEQIRSHKQALHLRQARCLQLAQEFEHYVVVGVGDQMRIDGVTVGGDGSFFAFCATYNGEVEGVWGCEGNLMRQDDLSHFSETLETVRQQYTAELEAYRRVAA
jgi:hypothetical protein